MLSSVTSNTISPQEGTETNANEHCRRKSATSGSVFDESMALYATITGSTSRSRRDSSENYIPREYNSNLLRSRRPSRIYTRPTKTVIMNVGGVIFETYEDTLQRLTGTLMTNEQEMASFYRKDKGDYFFDRDPDAFKVIINYLRTGELHVPASVCGPALKKEFQFWGVDELDIARCCWTQYNTWNTQSKSLDNLDKNRKYSLTASEEELMQIGSDYQRFRAKIWNFLYDPGSSREAKVFAWISVMVVMVSIFSFCAETHPLFFVPISQVTAIPRAMYREIPIIPEMDGQATEIAENGTMTNNSSINLNQTDEQMVPHPALIVTDYVCFAFFALEYFTRLVFAPQILKFILCKQNIVDILALLPDFVEIILILAKPGNTEGSSFVEFMFILRIMRLCRIFRLIRHVPGLWILLYTLQASFNELLLMTVFLLIGMVVFSSLVYFAENDKDFTNIPVGFWWSVITMTTVGYGDMVPKTAIGYMIGSLCAISGLLMIAFTIPIIVSNFVLYYTHVQYGLARRENIKPKFVIPLLSESREVLPLDFPQSRQSMAKNHSDPIKITIDSVDSSESSESEIDGNCNKL